MKLEIEVRPPEKRSGGELWFSNGRLRSLNKPGNGYKSKAQVSVLETFFLESLGKQAIIVLYPCSEGDADGTG